MQCLKVEWKNMGNILYGGNSCVLRISRTTRTFNRITVRDKAGIKTPFKGIFADVIQHPFWSKHCKGDWFCAYI